MQTKISPIVSGSITAIVTAFLAAGATIGVLNVTTGVFTTAKVGSSGSTVDLVKIAASTVNADSMSAGAATSSAISFTGASVGDHVAVGLTGNWAAPSSSAVVTGSVTAADTVTLYFKNTSSSAVDLTSASYAIEVTSQ